MVGRMKGRIGAFVDRQELASEFLIAFFDFRLYSKATDEGL